jgi:hypothetical protein
MQIDAMVEFSCKPADCLFVADIGCAQTARRQPAEVTARFNQDDRLSHSGGLDGGDNAGGRAPIDHNVKLLFIYPHLACASKAEQQQNRQNAAR